MKDSLFPEKLTFIVGFIAIFIALYPLKTYSDNQAIFILFGEISLTNLVLIFLGLLSLSLYFYALNYIRYDFPIFSEIKKLAYIEYFAHFFYLIAVIYPLLVIGIYIISRLIHSLVELLSKIITPITADTISIVLGMVASFMVGASLLYLQTLDWQKRMSLTLGVLDSLEKKYFLEVKEHVEKGENSLALAYLYEGLTKLLELSLIKKLNIDFMRIEGIDISLVAYKNNLINKDDLQFIKQLKDFRNKTAHNVLIESTSKSETINLIKRAEEILRKIKPKIYA